MINDKTDCKACETNQNVLPTKDVAKFASSGNLTGALSSSFNFALDTNTSNKVGKRLGSKRPDELMSFLETPGTNKQKNLMSSSQKNNHLINSIGLGNFSLNSTYESGLINSIASSRNNSSSFLLLKIPYS